MPVAAGLSLGPSACGPPSATSPAPSASSSTGLPTTGTAGTDHGPADSTASTEPPGEASSSSGPEDADSTTSGVPPSTCGDGRLDPGEACDDGDRIDTDDCTNACQPATCGDAVIWAGHEQCDDGNDDPTDACTDTCQHATCGDGIVWADIEQCDDANLDPTDACGNDCIAAYCGDGIVWTGVEQCDDANADPTDECTTACLVATCGDGVVWAGQERCDDGNLDGGDGCNADCEPETGFACDTTVVPSLCFFAAFFAVGSHGNPGSLHAVALDGSAAVELGPVPIALSGLAFAPDGTLYATTANDDLGSDSAQLGVVDPYAAGYTPVAWLDDPEGTLHPAVPDIAFMGEQLVGWTETFDDLLLIDRNSGQVTVIPVAEGSMGTGLAYAPQTDTVILAPDGAMGTLFFVDELGGLTEGPLLMGSRTVVKGLSVSEGILFGMDTDQGAGLGDFVSYDPMTGSATVIAALPAEDIDAIAVFDPDNGPRADDAPDRARGASSRVR